MKHHFVKTDNYQRLLDGIRYMETRGSATACLALLHGEPGVGKTRNISKIGPDLPAILVKGHVGMTLDGLIWSVSQGLGIAHQRNRTAEMKAQFEALAMSSTRIVLDEAQFGLYMRHNGRGGAGIEYLRDICERGESYAILICHQSEVPGFSDSKHIRTRIGHMIELVDASPADTAAFVRELCEVPVDDGVTEIVHAQTKGKYRLVENAIGALEVMARMKGMSRLVAADVRGVQLVVDHEASLIPKAVNGVKKKVETPALAIVKDVK